MPLTEETSNAISNYLLGEITRYIKENATVGDNLVIKPFHARLLPLLFNVKFSERSFSTRSGGWFQQMAALVAKQFHPVVEQQFTVRGRIQPAASTHIETLLGQMDKGRPKRKPHRIKDNAEVLTVQSSGGAELEIVSDLFIQTITGREWYFEMKTAQPSKGQCKEMKRTILQITALRHKESGEAFASMAYNAKGDGEPIKDGKIRQFLEPGADIIVGRQFWTKIGDESTYDELLAISEKVGHEVTKLIEATALKPAAVE